MGTPASSVTTPPLASRADTGEVVHIRMRSGRAASGRGAERFVNETVGRVRRAGAAGPLLLGADAGFWSAKVVAACRRHDVRFSITVGQIATVKAAIAAISEDARTDIDYPAAGRAQATCGRTGATTHLSPTVPATRSPWTPTITSTRSAS